MMRALIVTLPFLCASSQPDAAAWGGALSIDDECGSISGADCGLNALQLNGDRKEATRDREAMEADLLARSVNATALAVETTAGASSCTHARISAGARPVARPAVAGPNGSATSTAILSSARMIAAIASTSAEQNAGQQPGRLDRSSMAFREQSGE
eukprot:CAMPEP_0204564354 /NCGR_PEP_ID=MMETSP0661-20131031/34837_1 /ASSEMBLY_ACC=CAM_ASM_000606 /TAXON_ID=109239 /ORGANISM="Alexandrium margalefi, Strain AMGDE01CS-322" /LENGTH=155 /DNA_ID=CAMNT_0051571989 /DNA_START=75 /DNA_END=540 /DNA_ORIENTATION=+